MPAFRRSRHRATLLAAVALALLLPLLAVLQYRWIGEVSQAERERLRAAPEHFAEDFDRELTRAFLSFQSGTLGTGPGDRKSDLIQQARRWRTQAPRPQLLRAIYVAERSGGEGSPLALSRLDPAADRFVPAPWPPELAGVAKRLAAGPVPPLDGEAQALLVPLQHQRPGERPEQGHGESGYVVLELDRAYIVRSFLPELAERWFEVSGDSPVLLAVKAPGGLLYRSDPQLPAARFLPGDMQVRMFSFRRIESLHGLVPGGFPGPNPGAAGPRRDQPLQLTHDHDHEAVHPPPHRRGMGGGTWTLAVTHPAGSLEATVARARTRNLAVSFGAIALVAASLAVLGLSLQRARLLARQQLELVAGITHELNTPLAAIRSAGQNLADGVVSERGHVKRYGALIEREGARLSGMVGKALELAGIQSGRRLYRSEPVAVTDVVDDALADSRFLLEERGIEVVREIPAGLPLLWADRAALRLALVNLMDNAAKYAASGRLVTVRAALVRGGRGGRQVSLTVEDRGPGIPAEDRPHLFEPFYRGREVAALGGVPGSGLGLSLVRRIVEAQRGTVSAGPGAGGKGSAFTLRLPLAPTTGEPGLEAGKARPGEPREATEAL